MKKGIDKDRTISLQELIKLIGFDCVSSKITEEIFSDNSEKGVVELISFYRRISSAEAIEEIKRRGYRTANLKEVLLWASKKWNRKDMIVIFCENNDIICLCQGGSYTSLQVHYFNENWDSYWHFAVVRKH